MIPRLSWPGEPAPGSRWLDFGAGSRLAAAPGGGTLDQAPPGSSGGVAGYQSRLHQPSPRPQRATPREFNHVRPRRGL